LQPKSATRVGYGCILCLVRHVQISPDSTLPLGTPRVRIPDKNSRVQSCAFWCLTRFSALVSARCVYSSPLGFYRSASSVHHKKLKELRSCLNPNSLSTFDLFQNVDLSFQIHLAFSTFPTSESCCPFCSFTVSQEIPCIFVLITAGEENATAVAPHLAVMGLRRVDFTV
jgi:hypothetical protein